VRRLPAEEGVWAFVIGDMVVFGIFFNVFAYYHRIEPVLFTAGQQSLNAAIGLANTFILLTSSWFVVLALRAVRARRRQAAMRWLGGGVGCGILFILLKLFEYSLKIRVGINVTTNDFYMLYFMFTGIHLLHLMIGSGILVSLILLARRSDWSVEHIRYFESGAIFWHMVDLLWIVLFPLIFLVR
jgi:nitric oxide reductase NorE protein